MQDAFFPWFPDDEVDLTNQVSGEAFLDTLHTYLIDGGSNIQSLFSDKNKQRVDNLNLSPSCLYLLSTKAQALQFIEDDDDLESDEATEEARKFRIVISLLRNIVSLRIEPPQIEKSMYDVDLSLFPSLVSLVIVEAPITTIHGLLLVRRQLNTLEAHKCISSIEEILCHAENRDHPFTRFPNRQPNEEPDERYESDHKKGHIQEWERLKILSCSYNGLTSMDKSLKLLPKMEILDLSNNLITRIQNLQECYSLRYLNVGHNEIRDVNDLCQVFGNVTTLVLRNNRIASTSGLERLFALEKLDLSCNLLSSMSEIENISSLPCLQSAWLFGNPIAFMDEYRPKSLTAFTSQILTPIPFFLDDETVTEKERVIIERDEIQRRNELRPAPSYHSLLEEKTGPSLTLQSESHIHTHSRSHRKTSTSSKRRRRRHATRLAKIAEFKPPKQTPKGITEEEYITLCYDESAQKGYRVETALDPSKAGRKTFSSQELGHSYTQYIQNLREEMGDEWVSAMSTSLQSAPNISGRFLQSKAKTRRDRKGKDHRRTRHQSSSSSDDGGGIANRLEEAFQSSSEQPPQPLPPQGSRERQIPPEIETPMWTQAGEERTRMGAHQMLNQEEKVNSPNVDVIELEYEQYAPEDLSSDAHSAVEEIDLLTGNESELKMGTTTENLADESAIAGDDEEEEVRQKYLPPGVKKFVVRDPATLEDGPGHHLRNTEANDIPALALHLQGQFETIAEYLGEDADPETRIVLIDNLNFTEMDVITGNILLKYNIRDLGRFDIFQSGLTMNFLFTTVPHEVRTYEFDDTDTVAELDKFLTDLLTGRQSESEESEDEDSRESGPPARQHTYSSTVTSPMEDYNQHGQTPIYGELQVESLSDEDPEPVRRIILGDSPIEPSKEELPSPPRVSIAISGAYQEAVGTFASSVVSPMDGWDRSNPHLDSTERNPHIDTPTSTTAVRNDTPTPTTTRTKSEALPATLTIYEDNEEKLSAPPSPSTASEAPSSILYLATPQKQPNLAGDYPDDDTRTRSATKPDKTVKKFWKQFVTGGSFPDIYKEHYLVRLLQRTPSGPGFIETKIIFLVVKSRIYLILHKDAGTVSLIYSCAASRLTRVVLGLYLQYFRVDTSDGRSFTIVTRDKQVTYNLLDILYSEKEKASGSKRLSKQLEILNQDKTTLQRIEDEVLNKKAEENVRLYALVYQRHSDVRVSEHKESAFQVPVIDGLIPRTLILTDARIYLCKENLARWIDDCENSEPTEEALELYRESADTLQFAVEKSVPIELFYELVERGLSFGAFSIFFGNSSLVQERIEWKLMAPHLSSLDILRKELVKLKRRRTGHEAMSTNSAQSTKR